MHEAELQVTLCVPDPDDFSRVRDIATARDMDLRVGKTLEPAGLIIVTEAHPAGLPATPAIAHAYPLDHRPAAPQFRLCYNATLGVIEANAAPPEILPVLERLSATLGWTLVHSLASDMVLPLLIDTLLRTTDGLLLQGATPEDIDDALCAMAMPLGPYAMDDREGVSARPASPLRQRARAEGRLGRAIGVGWYRYPGGGGRVVDPLIEDLIAEEAHFAGIPRRNVTADEMCATVVTAMADALQQMTQAKAASQADLATLVQALFGPTLSRQIVAGTGMA